jgi:hypothetical protein
VTLELLKRLEGEVVNTLHDLGATSKMELEGVMVTPANFYGIELNPRAAAIAEQVLWIGFLQWHLRTHGNLHNLPEPIIKDLHNIECRDAVLEWDDKTPELDADGNTVTLWDGRTTMTHPITGEEVPDPEARTQAYRYSNPRPAQWPATDYVVGNPPFIGNKRMRFALGDGYAEAIREAWHELPENIDFVMYWWDRAAELTSASKLKRFGFITTNSLKQTFNRKVLERHLSSKKPVSLSYAIADHPWVDSADGAAVRVSLTVAQPGKQEGVLQEVTSEVDSLSDNTSEVTLESHLGYIHADLTIGPDISSTHKLKANLEVCFQGMNLVGKGFRLTANEVHELGFDSTQLPEVIKPHCNARDMMQGGEHCFLIDLFGLEEKLVREKYSSLYQHLNIRVKPERDHNKRKSYRLKWWVFGEPRGRMRKSMNGLSRFIATPETTKHRLFSFFPMPFAPDHKLYVICSEDAWLLGVLSSRIHKEWSLGTGSQLGPTPVYVKSIGFDCFPFPAATELQKETIRALGEQLDAHRKHQQAQHPDLTLTGMYNVLERVCALESENGKDPLTVKEKKIYDQGLVGILRKLHDELDEAVAVAYGWPMDLSQNDILFRLVELNKERAAEEAQGHVRWLRPEYQAPNEVTKTKAEQTKLDVEDDEIVIPVVAEQREWPKEIPAQATVLSEVLGSLPAPMPVEAIAAHFKGKVTAKKLKEVERLLETFAALGRAELVDGSWVRSE